MLVNAAKCQGHSFYRFWAFNGKPTSADSKLPHHLLQLRLISRFNKKIGHCYMLLKFAVNTHELLLWKTKMVLQLLMV